MINVILSDDQKIVREGLKMILSLDDEINIVDEAENGRQIIQLLDEKGPNYTDVILMDVRMPLLDGVEATKIIKESLNYLPKENLMLQFLLDRERATRTSAIYYSLQKAQ